MYSILYVVHFCPNPKRFIKRIVTGISKQLQTLREWEVILSIMWCYLTLGFVALLFIYTLRFNIIENDIFL